MTGFVSAVDTCIMDICLYISIYELVDTDHLVPL